MDAAPTASTATPSPPQPPVSAQDVGGEGGTSRVSLRATTRSRPRGATGTIIQSGTISGVESNSDLRGSEWVGQPGTVGTAGRMMTDAHVRQSVDYIANPLGAGTWAFKPAGDSPLDREVARYCAWSFLVLLPWVKLLRATVVSYSMYGVSLREMTDGNRRVPADRFPLHPGGGVGVVPTGLHDRPAWTVDDWIQSRRNTEQLHSIVQRITGSDAEKAGTRTIRANRLIRHTYDQEGANFLGRAPLRSAYGPWKIKVALTTIDAMKHERQGMGTPTITLGPDADDEDIDTAEDVTSELRANERGNMVLPHGYMFAMNADGGGSDIAESLERQNRDIAMNVAAGYMLLGQTGPGSYALGSTQQGQHHLNVEFNGNFFADAFNTGSDGWSPVERITRLNYGPDVTPPTLMVRNLPTRNWVAVTAKVNECVKTGVITADDQLEAEVRDSLQVGPHDPDTARVYPGAAVDEDDVDEDTDEPAANGESFDDTDEEGADDE